MDPVHEDITKTAADLANMPLNNERTAASANSLGLVDIIHGVRWNDLPDERVLEGLSMDKSLFDNVAKLAWDLKMAPLPLRGMRDKEGKFLPDKVDMSKVSLPQRSHYFDYQHLHSMTPCTLVNSFLPDQPFANYRCKTYTNEEVVNMIASQASEWFVKGCLNKVAAIETDRKSALKRFALLNAANRKSLLIDKFAQLWNGVFEAFKRVLKPTQIQGGVSKGIEGGDFYIGNLLHMIEDSYSGAHATRFRGATGRLNEGPIVFFQDYSAQDGAKHEHADKKSCETEFKAYEACGIIDILALERPSSNPTVEQCRSGKLNILNDCYRKKLGDDAETLARGQVEGTEWDKIRDRADEAVREWKAEANAATKKITGINGDILASDEKDVWSLFHSDEGEWKAAPGALMAALQASRILKLYKNSVAASTPTNPAGCEAGAKSVVSLIKNVIMPLAAKDAVSGGTMPAFAGQTCPSIAEVLVDPLQYTVWDKSTLSKMGDSVKNINVVKGIKSGFTRLKRSIGMEAVEAAADRDAYPPVDSLELTCVVPCRNVAGVKRVSPACVFWNPSKKTYELKCCLDVPDSVKFREKFVRSRLAPSMDAILIRKATAGLGHDSTPLMEILLTRSPSYLLEIQKWYSTYFHKSLLRDVQILSLGSVATLLTDMIRPNPRSRNVPINREVETLRQALSKKSFFSKADIPMALPVLSGNSPARLSQIRKSYQTVTGQSLFQALDAAGASEALVYAAQMLSMGYKDAPDPSELVSTNPNSNILSRNSNLEVNANKEGEIERDLARLKEEVNSSFK